MSEWCRIEIRDLLFFTFAIHNLANDKEDGEDRKSQRDKFEDLPLIGLGVVYWLDNNLRNILDEDLDVCQDCDYVVELFEIFFVFGYIVQTFAGIHQIGEFSPDYQEEKGNYWYPSEATKHNN